MIYNSSAKEIRTTVIIPNYNGLHFLKDCLESLKSQTAEDFEVLIVDNGSTDGSREWISENNIKSILLEENLGFAGGVNAGLKQCEAKYALLLNNDTVAEPDFVAELEKAIEKSDSIFAVSPMMIMASNHEHIDDAGDGFTITGWAYQRGVDEPVEQYQKEKIVFSACAGASIYKMDIVREVGYFDEMHFAYLEDIDLCYRAKLAGYHNRYCPKAKVYHVGSGTSGSKYNSFKVKLAARNNIYLLVKNQPALQLIINLIPLLIGFAVKAGFFYKKGFISDYLGGLAEGIRTAGKCKKAPKAKYGFFGYLLIEGEMIINMVEYTVSFIRRKTKA